MSYSQVCHSCQFNNTNQATIGDSQLLFSSFLYLQHTQHLGTKTTPDTQFSQVKAIHKKANYWEECHPVGYQPTLCTEMGSIQERIVATKLGSITSISSYLCTSRWLNRSYYIGQKVHIYLKGTISWLDVHNFGQNPSAHFRLKGIVLGQNCSSHACAH